jgi:hypothetical protein
MNNVNTSTAPRYYAFAEECKCAKLRKKIVDYFCNEYAELSLNEEFKELMRAYPILSVEISRSFIESNTRILLSLIFGVFVIVVIIQLKYVFF